LAAGTFDMNAKLKRKEGTFRIDRDKSLKATFVEWKNSKIA
jgi:hypothetical protein